MSFNARRLLATIVSIALPWAAFAQDAARPAPQPPGGGVDFEAFARIERHDFGVPPTDRLHAGPMHGPTPASIPGGQVVTTQGLVALIQGRQAPFIVVDVLGQPETLPNAVAGAWLAQPGTFDDPIQRQAAQMLGQLTQGRNDVALVFYCLSRECWMSYNAALRAIRAGFANVLWYRGGTEAWKAAGLPMQHGQPGQQPFAQQSLPQQPFAQQPYAQQQARRQPPGGGVPAGFAAVEPIRSSAPERPASELRISQGRFFSFAVPQGWRVGEEGQYAVTLQSPDNRALTLMVGNSGLPLNYSPARFAYDKLSSLRPQNLNVGQPRQARPAAGFGQAVEFDVSYSAGGVAVRGVAKVSMAPGYDSTVMAMTAAVASVDQWPGYASWLPLVADQVSATNGAAFGRRGIMQQNLQNSIAFGEAAQQYRDWSQQNWQSVTNERLASQDRRNFAIRENLGGVQTFANPYGTTPPLEMPMTHKYYWTDRQGRLVGTDDPSADPNAGSTGEWRRMERVGR